MIKPKVVLLIFVSGKIVLTGAKVIVIADRHDATVHGAVADHASFVDLLRSERRFTLHSTQSTLCCASSGNHKGFRASYPSSSRSHPLQLHYLLRREDRLGQMGTVASRLGGRTETDKIVDLLPYDSEADNPLPFPCIV